MAKKSGLQGKISQAGFKSSKKTGIMQQSKEVEPNFTMQLTRYTDYSLRTLIYLGAHEGTHTIAEIANSFGISRNHLVKVVHNLGKLRYIDTLRGKSGGIKLAHDL